MSIIQSVQPSLIFITGASGAGKTTITRALQGICQEWPVEFLYFDSIGVPSVELMIEQHGSPSGWQEEMTLQWVEKILNDYLDRKVVVLEGQINLDFINSACRHFKIDSYQVILIHCSHSDRMMRLSQLRQQPELANADMDNWAEFLLRQAQESEAAVLNTSEVSVDYSVSWLKDRIQEHLNIRVT